MKDTLRLFSPNPDEGAGKGAPPPATPDDPVTVRDVIERYLEHARTQYEPRSLAERRRVLDRFLRAFGELPLAEAKPADLAEWIAGQPRWKSDWTRRYVCSVVQRPFNWAVHYRLIEHNPFKGAAFPEGDLRRPMEDHEYRALMRATEALFRRVLLFLRYSGARPGEMSGARWPDVDWKRECLILDKHKTRKKTKKPRVIPLVPVVMRLLRWMHDRAADRQGHIFVNRWGTPWNRSSLALRFQNLRYRARVPEDCKLYGTRHAYATQGVLNGANLKLLSKSMGHARVATLEKYYVHLDLEVDAMREAAKKSTETLNTPSTRGERHD